MKLTILGTTITTLLSTAAFAAPTLTTTTATATASSTTGSFIAQHSPVFPNMAAATDVVTSYNAGPYNTSGTLPTYQLTGYPEVWKTPDTTSAEVQAAIALIDWSLVPNAPVRKTSSNGDFSPDTDGPDDRK